MAHIKQAWARLRSFLLRRELDREFDEEAHSHLALSIDDYTRSGVPEAEARRMACLQFGSIEAAKMPTAIRGEWPGSKGFFVIFAMPREA